MVVSSSRRLSTLGLFVASLLFAGCGSGSRGICKWADDCGDLGIEVEECVERIEDGIDDEHYDVEEVGECNDCLQKQGDDCDDGWRECLDQCGAIVVEVTLDL